VGVRQPEVTPGPGAARGADQPDMPPASTASSASRWRAGSVSARTRSRPAAAHRGAAGSASARALVSASACTSPRGPAARSPRARPARGSPRSAMPRPAAGQQRLGRGEAERLVGLRRHHHHRGPAHHPAERGPLEPPEHPQFVSPPPCSRSQSPSGPSPATTSGVFPRRSASAAAAGHPSRSTGGRRTARRIVRKRRLAGVRRRARSAGPGAAPSSAASSIACGTTVTGRVEAVLDRLVAYERRGRDPVPDRAVHAERLVEVGLDRSHRAPGARALDARGSERLDVAPAPAALARRAVREQRAVGAPRLEVVERHHHRHAARASSRSTDGVR